MSSSQFDKRIDPLIDAYRQASELEAQAPSARPGAALRAAVLAHARVVAQSAATADPKLAVNEAFRATPAANESRPIWRIAAGVVLGLAGMWIYQLTRPGTLGEASVAVMSTPQAAKSMPIEADESKAAPVAPVTAGAPPPVVPANSPNAPRGAPAPQETTVAVAALPPSASAPTPATATAARETVSRERASGTGNNTGIMRPRHSVEDASRSDTAVALAKVDTPARRAEQAVPVAAQTAVTAAPVAPAAAAPAAAAATTSAIPEVAASEPFGETAVASVEMQKFTRPSAAARTAITGAPSAKAAVPPNAFPASTSGTGASAAAPPASPVASPQSAAGGSAAMRQGVVSTPDAAMFAAIRAGNLHATRAALARGANVNARDETGRSALQIARERNDPDMLKTLELAGAK